METRHEDDIERWFWRVVEFFDRKPQEETAATRAVAETRWQSR